MPGKRPSSLDYEAYVDELAVSSFRRALADCWFDKARSSAERLVASAERMWRWVGFQHLAVLELAQGFKAAALEALEGAARLYPDVAALGEPPRKLGAQLLIDIGEPEQALRWAEPSSYHAGLALARSSQPAEARALADRIQVASPALAAHLRWEALEPKPADALREIIESVPEGSRAPMAFQLARMLDSADRLDEALALYETIANSNQALHDWTVTFVRSHYHLGMVYLAQGRDREARAALARYLGFWEQGEIDRADVARAAQCLRR